ncbi:MAG: cysteine dioxygenase [Acidimicrobiales bacterium]
MTITTTTTTMADPGEATMQQRIDAVNAAMNDIRRIEADLGVTRTGVEAIRDRLIELASNQELFSFDDFPTPTADDPVGSFMYRLAQDDDDRFALYLQSSTGNDGTPVHNHTTWAVVVGFAGHEENTFFERTPAGPVLTGNHNVRAGTGVAMLPDDLHAIRIEDDALNFHCYGLALERLDTREYWSASDREWKIFDRIDGIVEARPLASC